MALASLVLVLLVAEIGASLLGLNPYDSRVGSRILELRTQHADAHRLLDRSGVVSVGESKVRFETDSRGYIKPSKIYPDPDVTIAFMGGSTTECSFVQEFKRFPYLVGKLLGDEGLKVNVLNAGRSGNNIHHSLNILINHIIVDKPNYVVVMHAANDIGLLAATGSYELAMGSDVTLSSVSKLLVKKLSTQSSLVGILRYATIDARMEVNSGSSGQQIDAGKKMFEERIAAFAKLGDAFGFEMILMTQPSGKPNDYTPNWVVREHQESFNESIRKVAESEGVQLIDLDQHINSRDDQHLIFYDGIHVTDHGSEVYAKKIVEEIARMI